MRLWLVGATALSLASAAAAAAEPAPAADPRVRTLTYDSRQVYRIVGALRSATQVLLAPDEVIQHVALGDAAAWEAVPEGHVLFLKPNTLARPTNLIVTSRRGGETRHYAFELLVRSGPIGRTAPDTFFQVRFRYPEAERRALVQVLDAQAAALEAKVLQLKLDRGVLEGPRNLAYTLQGPAALSPSEVSDNGRFTVLRFPAAQALPVPYAVEADGAEALVPFDVRGEFLVIHGVRAQLRLRRGREVVCIWNAAATPYGRDPRSGTSTPDVVRTDRPESGQ